MDVRESEPYGRPCTIRRVSLPPEMPVRSQHAPLVLILHEAMPCPECGAAITTLLIADGWLYHSTLEPSP